MTLATWILCTAIGVSIDLHFCKGELFSIGFNASAEICLNGERSGESQSEGLKKRSCCDSALSYFQNDSDYKQIDFSISFPQCIDKQLATYDGVYNYPNVKTAFNYLRPPPDRQLDLLALYSVLRI